MTLGKRFQQHPDVEVPGWLRSLGFVDDSWSNDAMPKARLELLDLNSYQLSLEVWVNYPDKARREVPPAFMVVLEMDDCRVVMYEGDHEDIAIGMVQKMLAQLIVNLQPLAQKVGAVL